MVVRAVLFDLGNTLVAYYGPTGFRPILRSSLQNAAHALDFHPDPSEEEQILKHALVLNREPPDFAVRPLEGRLRELFKDHIEVTPVGLAAASAAFLAPIFASARPDPDAIGVLGELRRRGVKTAIVSNTPWGSAATAWRDELRRLDLHDKVDAVVLCIDVGWRKPHRAPFDRALELLSVSAGEAVFVGDHPQWDVLGAREVGLRPILLSPDGDAGDTNCTVVRSLAAVLEAINTHSDNAV